MACMAWTEGTNKEETSKEKTNTYEPGLYGAAAAALLHLQVPNYMVLVGQMRLRGLRLHNL